MPEVCSRAHLSRNNSNHNHSSSSSSSSNSNSNSRNHSNSQDNNSLLHKERCLRMYVSSAEKILLLTSIAISCVSFFVLGFFVFVFFE